MELDRVRGMLLGVALGDALGLPFEGLPSRKIRLPLDRFRLVGRHGFVSDDTEQTALLAQAMCLDRDVGRVRRRFRRSMVGWFARLPFGIGGATLRACVRMSLGLAKSGIDSAGNGAAMRSHPIALIDEPVERRAMSDALATLTHTDARALDAAWLVAEVSARALRASAEPKAILESLIPALRGELREALTSGTRCELDPESAAEQLGNTGFVVHSIGVCAWAFAGASTPMEAIERAIRAGGDTDTHASIVGGWAGARWGASALPRELLALIHDGPFGPTHLDALTLALVRGTPPPRWSWLAALVRNLALYPVILAHGFRRLIP